MRAIKVLGAIFIIMVISGVIAQMLLPYQYWPALHAAAKELVVKRGTDRDGTLNGKLYFRIGWGECLAVHIDEWQTLVDATHIDRYLNMRNYADSKWTPGWDANDSSNCPAAPLEVKPPFWRLSRPVYFKEYDSEIELWVRTKKSPYRVSSPDPAIFACTHNNARKDNGDTSNYWNLAQSAEVYDDDGTYTVASLNTPGRWLVAICQEQDIPVEDHRW